MKPASAKQKGRRLQQRVRDAILEAFPSLHPDDVRSTSMGASGADLQLSRAAFAVFPYRPEIKNVESLNIWKALAQAAAHGLRDTPPSAPLVVFSRNGEDVFATLPLPELLFLLRCRDLAGPYRRYHDHPRQ